MRFFVMSALFAGSLLCGQAFAAPAQTPSQTAAPKAEVALFAPIFVATPLDTGVSLNIVNGDAPLKGEIVYRQSGPNGTGAWTSVPVDLPATNVDHLRSGTKTIALSGLTPSTRYEYELRVGGKAVDGGTGTFMTRRAAGQPFRFVAITDAHVNPANPERNPVLRACADTAARNNPDIVLHLGDNIQTVGSTHGGPAMQEEHPNVFYIYFRQVLGQLQSNGGQFVLNGNWEGENGWHPEPNRSWARNARMALAPAPGKDTYPEGGSPNQDYYAFTWGDALFVTLNVTGYTPVNHEIIKGPGTATDWTLGKEQMAWLERTLANSKAPWKFIFIHHAVGGNAGDEVNSRYGRGGGRVAHIGEQAKVHALMQKYGVQAFFYGHDHVFTDMEVDGIHYICTGSAGAPWKFGTEETGYKDYLPDSGFTLVDVDGKTAIVRYMRPDTSSPEGKELYFVKLTAK